MNNKSTKSILLSYFSYILLFIGASFVSGSIVHSGNTSEIGKYSIIGILGITLFVTGSFLQEFIINQSKLSGSGVVKFFFYSLLLSVGIGMISGGTQHFSDFPSYSSYLIPIGLILSLISFLLKGGFQINKNLWIVITAMSALVAAPLFFGLTLLATKINNDDSKLCAIESAYFNPLVIKASANGGHNKADKVNCPTKLSSNPTTQPTHHCPPGQSQETMPDMCMPVDSMSGSMDTMVMSKVTTVKDSKSFIEYVIPHHQDAVDGSIKVLSSTKDPELKGFLNNVITNQSKEISMLKGYYKEWFATEYVASDDYQSMMKFENTPAESIDKTYVKNMVGHHSGIIDIAKIVLLDSNNNYKPEIKTLSANIIKDQENDNKLLNLWLNTKYLTSSTIVEEEEYTKGHTDGH